MITTQKAFVLIARNEFDCFDKTFPGEDMFFLKSTFYYFFSAD